MSDSSSSVAAPALPQAEAGSHGQSTSRTAQWMLMLGSLGVVYGDIGTSPLYALRESLLHAGGAPTRGEIIGIVSLLIWALIIVVTLKYVALVMRADNGGEGGTLSLMALAQSSLKKPSMLVTALGIVGASLFYGDSILTPAISVLSAVEGLKGVAPVAADYIVPITLAILVVIYTVQSYGTGRVAAFFGPIMLIWFATLTVLGVMHISDSPDVIAALNPYHALRFMFGHGIIGFTVLGSVFLAVTGAEALYADMGHFGRSPIRRAWLFCVLPALVLNYLGQGALALSHPEAIGNLFFQTAPEPVRLPFVILATVATVIASQAVISGAYSLTRQAMQLGLLPRLEVQHTSETTLGQIYMPKVNWLMLAGAIALVIVFETSSALASAYGIAVVGTMFVTSLLATVVIARAWNWGWALAALIIVPFLVIDTAFLTANLLKLFDGGYVPLLLGAAMSVAMWTWVRGTSIVAAKVRRDSVPFANLLQHARQEFFRGARARHRDLPDLGSRSRSRRDAAQPQAQQGAAREERAADGPHPAASLCPSGRPVHLRAGFGRLQEALDLLRLHGHAEHPEGAGAGEGQGRVEVRHHGDVVLHRPAFAARLAQRRHAAVAGQPLHPAVAAGGRPDRILPHPARARDRTGQPGHDLSVPFPGPRTAKPCRVIRGPAHECGAAAQKLWSGCAALRSWVPDRRCAARSLSGKR